MKIEIPDNCIIINGVCYEMTEDDKLECDGCVFNTPGKNGGCSADCPCLNIFNNEKGKFVLHSYLKLSNPKRL